MRLMDEVHEGICGAHQAGTKIRWLLRRYSYFWLEMEKDFKAYARGCAECLRHGLLQHVPSVPLNPVVKPWPFRGWAMDFSGLLFSVYTLYIEFSQKTCEMVYEMKCHAIIPWLYFSSMHDEMSMHHDSIMQHDGIMHYGVPMHHEIVCE